MVCKTVHAIRPRNKTEQLLALRKSFVLEERTDAERDFVSGAN